MRVRCLAMVSFAVLVVGCDRHELEFDLEPVAVSEPEAQPSPVALSEMPENKSETINESLESQGAEPGYLTAVRRMCKTLNEPEKKKVRHTEGSDKWKSQLALKVKDFRIYSPTFKKWTLRKVDNDFKTSKIRHRGPWYGYGLVVEVKNNSDQVLEGDSVYVYATFKSKTGERVCFSDASASRSWNSFAKKGLGGWVKEKELSEWPLRPQERKRYVVNRTSCFSSMFTETEPTSVSVEVYLRFRPLGSSAVITGPLTTIERSGGILRGLPVAAESKAQRLFKRKAPEPVEALYAAGDHIMIKQAKKTKWVPMTDLLGVRPGSTLKLGPMAADTPEFKKTYGATTVTIGNWKVMGWRKVKGLIKQGHKMLSAKVKISVDTSAVKSQLEGALATANTGIAQAQADQATKVAAMGVAQAAFDSVKGTEAEAGGKEALAAAKAELKAANAALKAASKALKSAEKALAGGMKAFLKTQAKNIGCGSFRLDVGRKSLKPYKGSLNGKVCKALMGGAPVAGTLWFDLERWDMPFVLTWKGPGGALQNYNIQSTKLATILKD